MMPTLHLDRRLLLAVRVIVGGIFLAAGLDKVVAVGAFADAVRSYHLLPPGAVLPFALAVPWIEVLVGLYLLAGFQVRLAAAGSMFLLAMFIAALGRALVLGDTDHACGCFGAGEGNAVLAFLSGGSTITPWDVIRDCILLALSALTFLGGAGALSLAELGAGTHQRPGVRGGARRPVKTASKGRQ